MKHSNAPILLTIVTNFFKTLLSPSKRTSAGLIDDALANWGTSNDQLKLREPDDQIFRAAETANMTLTRDLSSPDVTGPAHIIKDVIIKSFMPDLIETKTTKSEAWQAGMEVVVSSNKILNNTTKIEPNKTTENVWLRPLIPSVTQINRVIVQSHNTTQSVSPSPSTLSIQQNH